MNRKIPPDAFAYYFSLAVGVKVVAA